MTHHDVMCSIGGTGTGSFSAILLSHRRRLLRCRTAIASITARLARSKPISSRTKPCDGKLRRPYLRAPTIARRTHRWRKLRRNRSLGLHLLSSVRPETNPIVLLFADKPQDRRLVFLDAWITPDARIDEKVVVKVIVGRGDLANDALVREGPKLMIDAGD
jgi:hypothetical protein